MPDPAPVNQLTGGGAYPHEDCGEACVRSILITAGRAQTIAQIEAWDNTHGDWPGDGTGGDVVVSKLKSVGLASHVFNADTLETVKAGMAQGKSRFMVAIRSNANGDPVSSGGFGHWILVYGHDITRNVFQVMQPIGGKLVEYSVGSIEAAQQKYGVVIDTLFLDVAPVTVSAGAQSMWIAKKTFLMPNGTDGYLLDGWGGLHTIGLMPPAKNGPSWPGWDIARDVVVKPDYSGGYVLDGFGGIHPFACKGVAPPAPKSANPPPYWPNFDVAVEIIVTDWDTPGGHTMDGWGSIHPWGSAKQVASLAYWPGGHP